MDNADVRQLVERVAALRADFYSARLRAEQARVPDTDRCHDGDLVRIVGWYQVPTVSFRPAWMRCAWSHGRLICGPCTYDVSAEEAAFDAFVALTDAERELKAAREWVWQRTEAGA